MPIKVSTQIRAQKEITQCVENIARMKPVVRQPSGENRFCLCLRQQAVSVSLPSNQQAKQILHQVDHEVLTGALENH